MHILSPDTEFPADGKGEKSSINYYATYRGIVRLLAANGKNRVEILKSWDSEVFPSYLGEISDASDSDASDNESDDVADHPEIQAAMLAMRSVASSHVASTTSRHSIWTQDNRPAGGQASISSGIPHQGGRPIALEASLASLTLSSGTGGNVSRASSPFDGGFGFDETHIGAGVDTHDPPAPVLSGDTRSGPCSRPTSSLNRVSSEPPVSGLTHTQTADTEPPGSLATRAVLSRSGSVAQTQTKVRRSGLLLT
jgi:hypothetical protein